jgi:protein-disulfide isomerase
MPSRKKQIKEPVIEPIETEIEVEPVMDEPIEDTFTFKRSHFYSVLTVLAFAVGVLLGYVVWGYGSPEGANQTAQTADQSNGPIAEAPVTARPEYVRYDIPADGYPFLGPKDAPITIVEFSDYQCPYCQRWHQEVYEPLLAAYPGKIKFVYRHFPLTSIHPDAFGAAEAAMCAGEQNAYWQYHEMLFSGRSLGSSIYSQYAQALSLNMDQFNNCVTGGRYRAQIEADSNFAANLGVSSTPTFFINGLAIVGAQPLDVFRQVIDKELAGEIPE